MNADRILVALFVGLVIGGLALGVYDGKHPCVQYGPEYTAYNLQCVGWDAKSNCTMWMNVPYTTRDCVERKP